MTIGTVTPDVRRHLHGQWCVYCGEPATAQDHFPPRSYSHGGWIIPACLECNGMAGIEWSQAFIQRCRHVRQRLLVRYTHGKELGKWPNRNRRLNARLAWNVATYLQSIDPNSDFVLWCAARGIFTNCASGNWSIITAWLERSELEHWQPGQPTLAGWWHRTSLLPPTPEETEPVAYYVVDKPRPVECVVCGGPLAGQKHLYCSNACSRKVRQQRKKGRSSPKRGGGNYAPQIKVDLFRV